MQVNLKLDIKDVEEGKNYQVVAFDGEFDKAGHTEVKDQLEKIVADFVVDSLLFDFSNLRFINSEGIGYLIEMHGNITARGKKFCIFGVNDNVMDVFTTIGIDDIIPIYSNLSDFLSNQS